MVILTCKVKKEERWKVQCINYSILRMIKNGQNVNLYDGGISKTGNIWKIIPSKRNNAQKVYL